METFDFPYFTQATKYPESSTRVAFNNGYTFTAEPTAPDTRTFSLTFPAMIYYLNDTTNPTLNLFRLEKFYQRHRLHKKFLFPHPVYGTLEVRFNKPLEIPDGTPGGAGVVEKIQIELIEVIE